MGRVDRSEGASKCALDVVNPLAGMTLLFQQVVYRLLLLLLPVGNPPFLLVNITAWLLERNR
jgi:hypothetical protein